MKKLLTLDQLVTFCKENNFHNFSSKDSGYQLSVHIPTQFEVNEANNDDSMLFCKAKIFHVGRNRNNSSVTQEAAERAMKTMAYKPLLANFCEIDGVKDFTSHDMTVDENGELVYLEHQIGCITADEPFMEVDPETGNNFVWGYCAIPVVYSDACDIIKRKGGTKVSVELAVNEFQYNGNEGVLELTDVVVLGLTCLGMHPEDGTPVEEGMRGARLDIVDFSTQNNSIVQYSEKLDSLTSKVDLLLSRFDIDNSKEGGSDSQMNKFEELLVKYNKTVDDIDFDYESMSDEELESKFSELFGEGESDDNTQDENVSDDTDENTTECEDSSTDNNTPSDDIVIEANAGDEETDSKKMANRKYSEESLEISFEISHDDVRYALYNLLAQYEEIDNTYYEIREVYDGHFIFQDWFNGVIYGQKYTKDNDIIALEGERYKLYAEYITESEKAKLEEMRSNYELMAEELNKYKVEPEKMSILESDAYKYVANTDEFEDLLKIDNHFDLSVDEVKNKADELLLQYVKAGSFSLSNVNEMVDRKSFTTTKKIKSGRYGYLFSK